MASYIPIVVFFAANIWGLFGEIPSTTIQPTRPIFDRVFGSLQLASTVGVLQPLVQASWSGNSTMNWSENIDPIFPTEEEIFHQRANVTWGFLTNQATRTDDGEANLTNGGNLQVEIVKKMPYVSKAPSRAPLLELLGFPTWVFPIIIFSIFIILVIIIFAIAFLLMRQHNFSQWQDVQYLIMEIGRHQWEFNLMLGDLHARIPSHAVIAELCRQLNSLHENVAKILDGQNKIEDFLRARP